MFSPAARSSAARNPASSTSPPLVGGPGVEQPGLPQQAADVLGVVVRGHSALLTSAIPPSAQTISGLRRARWPAPFPPPVSGPRGRFVIVGGNSFLPMGDCVTEADRQPGPPAYRK